MVILMGSCEKGEQLHLYSGFFQNRTLEKGDMMYIQLTCSGPGGMFTTLGRMFSVGCKPDPVMEDRWEEALAAQQFLAGMLLEGGDPEKIFSEYNQYLERNGYEKEKGLFAFGQGYDHVERPSIQPGETMRLKNNMCMAVNTRLKNLMGSVYCGETYLLGENGPERLHKTPAIIFRT